MIHWKAYESVIFKIPHSYMILEMDKQIIESSTSKTMQ